MSGAYFVEPGPRGPAVPTVHLNGTSRAELLREYENAIRGVRDAIAAVEGAAPHGRDYYLNGTLTQAQREHASRVARLVTVQRELERIYEEVDR